VNALTANFEPDTSHDFLSLPLYDELPPEAEAAATQGAVPFPRAAEGQGKHRGGVPHLGSLPWRNLRKAGEAFQSGASAARYPGGASPSCPRSLMATAALRRTPKGSLAHAACDFMEARRAHRAGPCRRVRQVHGRQGPSAERSVQVVRWTVCAMCMICFMF